MTKKIEELKFYGDWGLSPALESTDHFSIKKQQQLFINGKFISPRTKKYFPTINPRLDFVSDFNTHKKLSRRGVNEESTRQNRS